jgi:hypothetical protein
MRITGKAACEELAKINATLQRLDCCTYLRISPRNGYHGLDVYGRDTHRCLYTVTCGTPRKCLDEARNYLSAIAVDVATASTPKSVQRWAGSLA